MQRIQSCLLAVQDPFLSVDIRLGVTALFPEIRLAPDSLPRDLGFGTVAPYDLAVIEPGPDPRPAIALAQTLLQGGALVALVGAFARAAAESAAATPPVPPHFFFSADLLHWLARRVGRIEDPAQPPSGDSAPAGAGDWGPDPASDRADPA